jgi:hypothetical protein
MAVTYSFDGRILRLTFTGDYSADDILTVADRAFADPALPREVRLLVDVTRSGSLAGRSADELRKAVDHFRPWRSRIGNRSAVLVGSPLQFGLIRMVAAFGEKHGFTTRIFRTEAEAVDWLSQQPVPGLSEQD